VGIAAGADRAGVLRHRPGGDEAGDPAGVRVAALSAAGIALASVLVFGRRMLVGVAVGAIAPTSSINASRGFGDPLVAAMPFVLRSRRCCRPPSARRSCAASCASR
jgi:hypothetical protein